MSVAEKFVSTSINLGYWVEPLLDILRGEKKLSFDEFVERAEILYMHRVKGNPLDSNVLETHEGRGREVKIMHETYFLLNGETDLAKRTILLKTVFMKTISQHVDNYLTNEQKEYVIKTSLPAALNACNASYLLQIDEYRHWLEEYRLGCSQQEVINAHTLLYSGYSEEEKEELSKKRAAVSLPWYNAYKKGEVTLEDVKKLLYSLKNSSTYPDKENLVMVNAFEGYKNLAFEFPQEKYVIYWEAIFQALAAFIQKAN